MISSNTDSSEEHNVVENTNKDQELVLLRQQLEDQQIKQFDKFSNTITSFEESRRNLVSTIAKLAKASCMKYTLEHPDKDSKMAKTSVHAHFWKINTSQHVLSIC